MYNYVDLLKTCYKCINWKAVDISTVYNIADFESDITKQVRMYLHNAACMCMFILPTLELGNQDHNNEIL